jgi:hypothetical protein
MQNRQGLVSKEFLGRQDRGCSLWHPFNCVENDGNSTHPVQLGRWLAADLARSLGLRSQRLLGGT